jgi:hypothetical protein
MYEPAYWPCSPRDDRQKLIEADELRLIQTYTQGPSPNVYHHNTNFGAINRKILASISKKPRSGENPAAQTPVTPNSKYKGGDYYFKTEASKTPAKTLKRPSLSKTLRIEEPSTTPRRKTNIPDVLKGHSRSRSEDTTRILPETSKICIITHDEFAKDLEHSKKFMNSPPVFDKITSNTKLKPDKNSGHIDIDNDEIDVGNITGKMIKLENATKNIYDFDRSPLKRLRHPSKTQARFSDQKPEMGEINNETKKIPGYAGYIPGVKPENLFGNTFARVTGQSHNKQYYTGKDLPSEKRYESTYKWEHPPGTKFASIRKHHSLDPRAGKNQMAQLVPPIKLNLKKLRSTSVTCRVDDAMAPLTLDEKSMRGMLIEDDRASTDRLFVRRWGVREKSPMDTSPRCQNMEDKVLGRHTICHSYNHGLDVNSLGTDREDY